MFYKPLCVNDGLLVAEEIDVRRTDWSKKPM
jgi:hypothetical protein